MKHKVIFLSIMLALLQVFSSKVYSQGGNAKSLEIGNKWVYKDWISYNYGSPSYSYRIDEVIGDTIINNKNYAVIYHLLYPSHSYERADSTRIYFYNIEPNNKEFVSVNFNQKDTNFVDGSFIKVDTVNFWGKVRIRITAHSGIYSLSDGSTSYIEGIGEAENHSVSRSRARSGGKIVAAIINGVKYGETILLDVNKEEELPSCYSLEQNYPNPFNPETKIEYSIPQYGLVTIKIFDTLGREIKTLLNEEKEAGNYTLQFDGSNFASGVYFYQLRAGNFTNTRKMILMK
jgi:hypothetical protein